MVEVNLPGKPTNRRWMKVLSDEGKFNELMNIKPDTKVRNLNRTLEAFEDLNTFEDLVNQNKALENAIAGDSVKEEEMKKRFLQITQGLKAILEAKLSQARSAAGKQGGSVKVDEKEEKMKAYEDKIREIITAFKSNPEINNDAKRLILQFGQLITNKESYKQRYMQELQTKFEKEMSPIISAWGEEEITGRKFKSLLLGKTFDSFSVQASKNYAVNDVNMAQTILYLTKYAKEHKQITMPRGTIKNRAGTSRVDLSQIIYEGDRLNKMILPLLKESASSNIKAELNSFVRQTMSLTMLSTKAIGFGFASDVLGRYLGATLKNKGFTYLGEIDIRPTDSGSPFFLGEKFTQSALNATKKGQRDNMQKNFRKLITSKIDTKAWGEAFALYIDKRGKAIDAVKDDYSLIAEAYMKGLEAEEKWAKRIWKQYHRKLGTMSEDDIRGDTAKQKKFIKEVKTKMPLLAMEYQHYEQKAKMSSGILIPSSLYESTSANSTVKQQWKFLSNSPSNDNFDEALYTTFALIYYNGEPEKIKYFQGQPKGEVFKDVFSIFKFIYAVNFIVGKNVGGDETTKIMSTLEKIESAITAAMATEKHDSEEKRGLYLNELKSGKDFLTIGNDIDKLGNLYAEALKENREQIPLLVKEQLQVMVDGKLEVEKRLGIGRAEEIFSKLVGAGFLTPTN